MLQNHLHLNEFAVEPLVVDENNFDRKHYTFEPVRWEYLGDIRCLAIDVHPRETMRASGHLKDGSGLRIMTTRLFA